MKLTKHARIRMGQRGITGSMLEFVREHGRIEGDAVILDRKGAKALLDEIDFMRRQAIKVLDKGGIGVVEEGHSVVTAYNITGRRRHD